ncbi:isochorismate synthase [Thiolapillus sp.]
MMQGADKLQPVPVWLGRLRLELRQLATPLLSGTQPGLLSIAFEVPVRELSAPPDQAPAWLYWHQPARSHRLLGLGMAYSLKAQGEGRFQELDAAYRKLQASWTRITHGSGRARARAFLGFAFDPAFQAQDNWQGFDNAGLYIPQLLFEWKNGRCVLTFNCFRDKDTQPESVISGWIKQLRSALRQGDPVSVLPPAFLQTEMPGASAWKSRVAEAIAAMGVGELDKVVLTRQLKLQFPAPVPHRRLLSSLAQQYPGCTMLSVSFGQGVLLGATPERLFDMNAERIRCDALAGTFPVHLRQPNAEMEVYEHAPVVRAIEEALEPLCTSLKTDEAARPVSFQSLSHLYASVCARPKPGVRPLQILEALHPTPAVGGMPRDPALAWIRQHEHLSRGWYTGAFGWLGDNQEAQMSVILRCALVQGKTAQLYAGAGITPVSNPEQELQETLLKFEPMLNALTR